MAPGPPRNWINRLWVGAGLLYSAALVALSGLQIVRPQRAGLLALSEIGAPYLFLPLITCVPLALRRNATKLRVALTACAVVYALRFVPGLISLPPRTTSDTPWVTALSWNLYLKNKQTDALRNLLATEPFDVVALQELTSTHSAAIESDPVIKQRYPWRQLEPGGADGMAILSALPVIEHGQLKNPDYSHAFPILWARLDLDGGQTLMVINAHPRSGRIGSLGSTPIPSNFDPSIRDDDIAYLRTFIDPLLQRGEPLLLLGDFNTTEREPGYRVLSAGLRDAHLEAGFGSGNTWRTAPLMGLPFALLRIDYMFSSPNVTPLRTRVDCTPRGSDHCALHGTFAVR